MLYAACTHFHFPQNHLCCVLCSGCEILELFVFLSSLNIVLATFAYHHCTWKGWNTVAGVTDGEANWKNQQNLYRGGGHKVASGHYALGGVKRRFFP